MNAPRYALVFLLASTTWLAAQQAAPVLAPDGTPAPPNTPPAPGRPPAAVTESPFSTSPGANTPPAPAATATPAGGATPAPATPAGPAAVATPPPPTLNITPPAATDTTVQYTPPPAGSSASDQTAKLEMVNYPDTDIRKILRDVADLYELNIVIPDSLSGTTSIKLRNVTWQQVFQVVLNPIGFTYVNDNSIIMIKSKSDLATEPLQTNVVPVNSASADELAKSLSNFIDAKAGESITPDPRTNFLIITARPSRMSNIQEAIDRLDRPTAQISIEAKFLELNSNDDDSLGIEWGLDGTPLAAIGTAWQYNIAHGLGAINSSGSIPSAGVLAQTVDNAAEAPIGSLGSNANLNQAIPTTALTTTIPSTSRRAADLTIFNQAQYNAVLHAVENISKARLVDNPIAVTMDNKEITIFTGTSLYIVFPTINNQTGQTQAGSNVEKDVGITMKVKPHVTNGGFINLALNPELDRVSTKTDTYFGASYPEFDTRKLTDANVSIKDGYTLAIGGLIDDEDTKVTNQIPILGDIPVLGKLFQTNETVVTRNNLIIFITAKTLNPDGSTYRDVINPEWLNKSSVTSQDVPGYYDLNHQTDPSRNGPGTVYASPEEITSMEALQKARDNVNAAAALVQLKAQMPSGSAGNTTADPPPAPAFRK